MTKDSELRPLKTWSHLAGQRRRPSEYEIVSTNLLWSTDDDTPWVLAPEVPMNKWYMKYRDSSPLKHKDWNAFRDPDELVYRTYNILQDGQEAYVDGLLDDHNSNGYDEQLSPEWLEKLALLYTPGRYLMHGCQMSSAYLVQIAPASTIINCALLQTADQLRWVSRIAYRTKELSMVAPEKGFAESERAYWENHEAWQGFRELIERILSTYDWGEHFVALNLVLKPAIDQAFISQLGKLARKNGDGLLGLLLDAQSTDSKRSERWTKALVDFILHEDANRKVLNQWLSKWAPIGETAIESYCFALWGKNQEGLEARKQVELFQQRMGLGS